MARLKSTTIQGTLEVTGGILNKATTSTQGVVQLSDATNSTSTTLAATANAVKKAYDLANGKANASHGNHVPSTESANNAKFLRNDNTWQLVTPANIGALASTGTAVAANKLATARTITLGNQLSGSASFDGSNSVTINAKINYITISSGDLNTYVNDGWYRCISTGNSNSVTNKPINTTDEINGFTLEVKRIRNVSSTDASVKQTFSWGTRLWERIATISSTGTTWQAWREIAFTNSNVASASKLATSRTISLTGGVTGTGKFDGSGDLTITTTIAGNAPTATKLATARTISLSGGVTGSGTFDGSGNLNIATTVSWKNVTNKPSIPGIIIGSGTFTPGGVTSISLGKTIAVANYHVTVTPIGNPDGSLGEVYVTNKTTTTFQVGCTGSTKGSFQYLVTYIQ